MSGGTGPWGDGNYWAQNMHLNRVPDWQTFAKENAEATAEIIDMFAHGRMVSAHHVDHLVCEEDVVWPRLYNAIVAAKPPQPDDPKKVRARHLVGLAVRDGSLVRQPCETCGAERTEAHHDDYDKPLSVRWLCLSHHRSLHGHRKPFKRRDVAA